MNERKGLILPGDEVNDEETAPAATVEELPTTGSVRRLPATLPVLSHDVRVTTIRFDDEETFGRLDSAAMVIQINIALPTSQQWSTLYYFLGVLVAELLGFDDDLAEFDGYQAFTSAMYSTICKLGFGA